MRGLFLIAACGVACARVPVPRPADTLDLFVVGTTDVHGWLRGWDYFTQAPDSTRGLSRLAVVVDSVRAAHPDRVLLVDAGDDLQGTAITSVALRDRDQPNPMIAAMNAMRYDAGVIGNHEFNYGLEYLNDAIHQARFPFLAANVVDATGRHVYDAWTMIERAGVRIAVVGGTTPGSMIWDRDKLVGRVEVRDIVPAVREAVAEARAAGADLVVTVLHSGLDEPSSYDTVANAVASENVSARVAREVPGIDVIVFGHSHRELADTTIAGVLLMQPRNFGGSVAVGRLRLARDAGRWRVVDHEGQVIRARGHAEESAVVQATAAAHDAAKAFAAAPLGSTPVAWSADSARVRDTPIIDFVLETQQRAAGADLASAAAFSLDARFGPGPITMGDLVRLYPYENNVLRVVRISGRQLREYLEFSARYFRENAPPDSIVDPAIPGFNFDIVVGVDYVLDLSRPIGSRVVQLSRAGRPVAATDTFTLALNDYRQSGGGGYAMLRGAPVVLDQQQSIRQLLADEVRRRGVLRPEDYFTRNWSLVPDSLARAAYRAMHPQRAGASRSPSDRE